MSAGERHDPSDSRSSVRPKLSVQIESFAGIAHELPPLFQRHWHELGTSRRAVPLDPDWDRYFLLEAQGTLRVVTARADDVLAGYIFNLVGPHLHYRSTVHDEIEMFWLDPLYRGGMFAVQWFRENERLMREEAGAKRISVAVKNEFMDGRVGAIFRRLGYKPVETVWSRTWA